MAVYYDSMLLFSSLSLVVMAGCAALIAYIRILRQEAEPTTLWMITACALIPLAIQQVGVFYIVMVFFGGFATTIAVGAIRGRSGFRWLIDELNRLRNGISVGFIAFWLAFSTLLSSALLLYVRDISYSYETPVRFGITGHGNVAMICAALLLLLPLFAAQFYFVWKRHDSLQLFVQICAALALALTSVLALPLKNQYKGVYFLAILIAISALLALDNLRAGDSKRLRKASKIVTTTLLTLVIAKFILGDDFGWRANLYSYRLGSGFAYQGKHIVYDGEFDGRKSAYYWIRDNTPPEAIVVTPLYIFRFENIVHERAVFVKRTQSFFTDNIPAYDHRVYQLTIFYNEDTSLVEYQNLIADMEAKLPGRRFYAVVKDDEVSEHAMLRRGAKLVYENENDGANVYLLNPTTGGS